MPTSSLVERIRKAGKVMIIGNGGSYANSQHLSNDLLSCGIPAYSMDPATLSAFANDFGWYTAFDKWVGICGRKGDLLIAMSGSGKSENILRAVHTAKRIGMDVECIYGAELGQDAQVAEEHQLRIGHEIMRALKVLQK